MKLTSLLILGIVLGLVSCSKQEEASEKKATTSETSTGLQSVLLDEKPSDVISVLKLRSEAKAGDQVAFEGKIMGRMDVLVDGKAIMFIGDPKVITSCDLRPGDNCQTPWDVCCDDSDDIKKSTVAVQALDANGKMFNEGFRDLGGIKELSTVVVQGTVAEGSDKDNMVVNMTGVFVVE